MGDLWIGGDEGDGDKDRPADSRVSEFARRPSTRDFPSLEQVLAYWTDLARAAGQVPSRKAVEPRALSGALPMTFILESVAPGVARFRVAGSQICDLMGMEVRGMPLISIVAPIFRDQICESLQTVLGRLAQARLELAGEGGYGRPPLEARMLLLPLLDDYGRPTRALGALEAKGQIGRTPRRFEITGQKTALLRLSALTLGPGSKGPAAAAANWRLRGSPTDSAAAPARPPEPAQAAGFAEAQRGFEAAPPAVPPPGEANPRRPWLRVIEGGKS